MTPGLFDLVLTDPVAQFLLFLDIGSLLVMILSEVKAKIFAFLIACGATFGLLFLYTHSLRVELATSLNVPVDLDRLATGIREGGGNAILGTPTTLTLGIAGTALTLVAFATGSRKLGAFIAVVFALLTLASLFGFLQPIISSLASR